LHSWLPHNLYLRVLLAMIACITLGLAGLTAAVVNETQTRLSNELLARGQHDAEILTSATRVYFAEQDSNSLTLIAAATTATNQVQFVAFHDSAGALLAAAAAPDLPLNGRTTFTDLRAQSQATGATAVHWADDYLDIVAPITYMGHGVGTVGLRMDISGLAAARAQTLTQGVLTALTLIVLLSLAMGLLLRQLVIVPLRRLGTATDQISNGVWVVPEGQNRRDELGRMARSFAQMVAALQTRETQLQEQVITVQALNAALDTKVVERTAELHRIVMTQEQLLNQVREMSIPVVPVLDGVIIVPLIGSIDSARAIQLIQNVLAGIEEHRASLAVLDITGVQVVDTHVARVLMQVADATRLLGATAVLVGIRPEVAQTLVQLGVDLGSLQTFATLQEALRVAFDRGQIRGHQQNRVSAPIRF
jgi:anti-anti-sigma factor